MVYIHTTNNKDAVVARLVSDGWWSAISWVGKLFGLKAALSTFLPLKAAVKVNLPISMLYDDMLWTTVMRSACGYKLHKVFWQVRTRGRSKVQGNHDPKCWETWHEELSPINWGADNYINMVEMRVVIVILARHDYPNNACILGKSITQRMLTAFLS